MSTESNEPIYVGNGKFFEWEGKPCFKIQVTQSELRNALKAAEERGWLKEFGRRDGSTDRAMELVAFPLKEENVREWKTHSLRLDDANYKKQEKKEAVAESDDDGLPF